MNQTFGAPRAGRWARRGLALLFALSPVASVGCLLYPAADSYSPPSVSTTASPDSGQVPLTVSFTGSVSGPDGGTMTYRWDFGDGTSSDHAVTQHVYTQPGDFIASFKADDGHGHKPSHKVRIRARGNPANRPPIANASATPTSGPAPLAVTFTGAGSDADGTIASYAWAFGDGGTSSVQSPAHTYASAGTFTAQLTVTDNAGATGMSTVVITASGTTNRPPSANASATPTSGTAPLTVNFAGSGTDADGTIASYAWVFGDGGTSNVQSPSHAYSAAGSYTARLTVTDNQGATGTATVTISVTGATNLAPTANAGGDQLNRDPGTTFTLTGAGSSDPDGSIVSYAWTQVSGPTVTLTGANTATPSFKSPAGTSGTYEFRLTVTDNGSPAGTATDNVVVSTRITYANIVGALFLARGTQSNGELLGCTSSGCHTGSNSRAPLSTYSQVYSSRSSIRSRIQPGNSMAPYLAAGEAAIITAWIDAGAIEKN